MERLLRGGDVTANIGGNLNITSVQDLTSSNAFSVEGALEAKFSTSPSLTVNFATDVATGSSDLGDRAIRYYRVWRG